MYTVAVYGSVLRASRGDVPPILVMFKEKSEASLLVLWSLLSLALSDYQPEEFINTVVADSTCGLLKTQQQTKILCLAAHC